MNREATIGLTLIGFGVFVGFQAGTQIASGKVNITVEAPCPEEEKTNLFIQPPRGFTEQDIKQIYRDAKASGIRPIFLLALGIEESGGSDDAISNKGAEGSMQLMPETSETLGVDPRNRREAITGAARWLLAGKFELPRFGYKVSERMLAKWYNCGINNLNEDESCGDHHASKVLRRIALLTSGE